MKYYLCPFAFCLVSIIGCSGSSTTSDEPNGTTLTGVFIDSAVTGLDFKTESQEGTTDSDGRFKYVAGETITFSIGSIIFPSAPVSEQITPSSLAIGSSNPASVTTNIARLLQSLDEDGDSSNGISIPNGANTLSIPLNFDITVEEFESNPEVINLVANSGSANTELISAEDANAHLNLSLASLSNADIMSFATGQELLAAGAAALTGPQIEREFRGRKFIGLDGSFDWEFKVDGTADSFDLSGADEDYLKKPWSVESDKLCRTTGDKYVCVTVFKLGSVFRLSMDGRDGSDGLEGWGIKHAS